MARWFPPTDFALIFCTVKNQLSKVNNRWGKFKLPYKKLIVHIKLSGFSYQRFRLLTRKNLPVKFIYRKFQIFFCRGIISI